MLEFAYFTVKCGMAVLIIKYIAETIQVLGGGKASEKSLLRQYIRSRLSSKESWNKEEETTTRWKDRDS